MFAESFLREDALYNDFVKVFSINVVKYDPLKANATLNVNVLNILYGENAIVNVSLDNDATGSVNLLINGVIYTNTVNNGQTTFNITNLDAGVYPIKITYLGDDKYNEKRIFSEFNVNKIKPSIEIIAWDANQYKQSYLIIKSSADGKILINNEYSSQIDNIRNGILKTYIISRISGNRTITVEFYENTNYLYTSVNTTYYVHEYDNLKFDVDFNISITDNFYGRCAEIKVELDKRNRKYFIYL